MTAGVTVARTAPPAVPVSIAARLRGWLANPWGRPRFLAIFTWLYIIWSIIPIIIAVQFSFNAGRSRSSWQGFSTEWWVGNPADALSVLYNPEYRSALNQSLKLAALTMLVATPIGVSLALGLARWRGRGAKPANFLMLFPLVTPEIVMGVSLFLVFTQLFKFVPPGTWRQFLGHITFTISFIVIIVRGRLFAIGKEYEEAAMDLGASQTQALRAVLLPLLTPAIFAALMIAFALSIDDFIITAFLVGDAGTVTIPVRIYSTARLAPSPALNALASILLFSSLIAITFAGLVMKRFRKREAVVGGSTVEDIARLEI